MHRQKTIKNWLWYNPADGLSMDERRKRFERIKRSGIDVLIPQLYNSSAAQYESRIVPVTSNWLEMNLPLARQAGLQVHGWMWCMPCNIDPIVVEHPQWFAVNGNGQPAHEKPPYVPYYKFMCPNHEGVQEFVRNIAVELAQIDGLEGVHLDYIRFPDVILASTLQRSYQIQQDREYPDYDYCYCETCRSLFKKQSGIDPLELKDPSANKGWLQFRYDSITHLVNQILIPAVRQHDKLVSAAVFPNWRHVRQQWAKWQLDAVFPMLYHTFYDQDIRWIKNMTRTGLHYLPSGIPLYSGLMAGAFNSKEFKEVIKACLSAGAGGVSFFENRAMTDERLQTLADFMGREL